MWDYVVSAAVMASFGRLSRQDRRRLLDLLARMARHPATEASELLRDTQGRAILI